MMLLLACFKLTVYIHILTLAYILLKSGGRSGICTHNSLVLDSLAALWLFCLDQIRRNVEIKLINVNPKVTPFY
jgi:hypothetical protein